MNKNRDLWVPLIVFISATTTCSHATAKCLYQHCLALTLIFWTNVVNRQYSGLVFNILYFYLISGWMAGRRDSTLISETDDIIWVCLKLNICLSVECSLLFLHLLPLLTLTLYLQPDESTERQIHCDVRMLQWGSWWADLIKRIYECPGILGAWLKAAWYLLL